MLLRLVMIAKRQRQRAAMVWSCCLSRVWQLSNKKNWFPVNFWRQEELSWMPKDLHLAAVGSCTCEWSVRSWLSVLHARNRGWTVRVPRQTCIATARPDVKNKFCESDNLWCNVIRCFTWTISQASALFLFSCINSRMNAVTRLAAGDWNISYRVPSGAWQYLIYTWHRHAT